MVIVSPDAGRVKVAERFAQHLTDMDADVAFINKRRPKGTHQRRRGQGGHRRGRRPLLHHHRRHDRHRRHRRLRRRAAARSAAHPRCGRWPPTACCPARPSAACATRRSPASCSPTRCRCPPPKQLPQLEVLSIAPIIAEALAAVFDDTSVSRDLRRREPGLTCRSSRPCAPADHRAQPNALNRMRSCDVCSPCRSPSGRRR